VKCFGFRGGGLGCSVWGMGWGVGVDLDVLSRMCFRHWAGGERERARESSRAGESERERAKESERRPSKNSGCGRGGRRAVCLRWAGTVFDVPLASQVGTRNPTLETSHFQALPVVSSSEKGVGVDLNGGLLEDGLQVGQLDLVKG